MKEPRKPKFEFQYYFNFDSAYTDGDYIKKVDIEVSTSPVEPRWWQWFSVDKQFVYWKDTITLAQPTWADIVDSIQEMVEEGREYMREQGYKETKESLTGPTRLGQRLASMSLLKKPGN